MLDYESRNGSCAAVELAKTMALHGEHVQTGSCQFTSCAALFQMNGLEKILTKQV